ncbi:DUF4105 domain-containing protein [Xanthomonas massiliensis]|uniref:lipoprotein N-acyltransferase Lnb domain-containing protein n=1 Tax=Xanthomonas massiliensis TaxID=1720302 RepID=UPI000B1B9BF8|nr:DUF4105 domain-containing protein [Xanthomonas massiliensis]
MPALRWRLVLALLCACLAPAFARAQAQVPPAPPRIGVMTMLPGEVFFERFGHDALVVADPASGLATSYNFGFFDPSEPDFVGNFARGRMMYYLVALPLEEDLSQYREAGRGVQIQWLDLPPEQARALAAALAEHARPENARYHYDYFTANCATKVRDMLDAAMGGALHAQLSGPAPGQTYRREAVRLASPAPWMWIGFDLGLGPYADAPLTRWQDGFIPMRLAADLATATNRDGRPLVQATEQWLPQRLAAEPADPARVLWPWALAGLALAAGIAALRRRPRLVAALALPLWSVCALGGVLLLYLWGFTAHQAAWANRNLLLLDPLCLPAIGGAIAVLRGRRPGRGFGWLLAAIAVLAALALPVYWLSPRPQANLPWIALLLPVHAALAWVLRPRRLPAPVR